MKENNIVKIQTEYKRELNKTHLLLKKAGVYSEDYQIRMLRENHIEGLLPLKTLSLIHILPHRSP